MGEVKRSGGRQEADRMEGAVEEGRRGGMMERGEERRLGGEE